MIPSPALAALTLVMPSVESLLGLSREPWPDQEREAKVQKATETIRRLLDEPGSLTPDQCAALYYEWDFWARPDQLPPPGKWLIWFMRSGRGAGKTRSGAEWVLKRKREGAMRIGLIGETEGDARRVIVEGESGLLARSPPWDMPQWFPANHEVIWRNGAIATIYSGDKPDQLRGPQHDTVYADELAKWKEPEEGLANAEFGLRLKARRPNLPIGHPDAILKPRMVITSTPRPIPVVKQLMADDDVVVTRTSTRANYRGLASDSIKRLQKRYGGTRRGLQELEGEVLDDVPGALWTAGQLQAGRIKEAKIPALVRIVVAIDPQAGRPQADAFDGPSEGGAKSGKGRETGIVACGKGTDDRAYVLEDYSGDFLPSDWGTRALALYRRFQADRIVGEENNGGAMVEYTLRVIEKNIPYKIVHASRGKQTRAEPVATLYEQGLVSHVGHFADLESELTTHTFGKNEPSPNRLDALVWCLQELMLEDDDEVSIHMNPGKQGWSPARHAA